MTIDYSKILKKSWAVAWKNKWLWVCGLAVSSFSGRSFNFRNIASNNNSPQPSPMPDFDPTNVNDLKDKTSYVLGTATNTIKDWYSSIPTSQLILIGILFIALVLIGWVVVMVLRSWAKGALILGLEDAIGDKEVNLISISKYGLKYLKKLVILGLISGAMNFVVSFAVTLGLVLVFGIFYYISTLIGTIGTILLVLIGIIEFLLLIYMMMVLTILSVYSERLVTIENYETWQAWKMALSLSRKYLIPTLTMGIVNSVVSFVVGFVTLIVVVVIFAFPVYLLVSPMFVNGFTMPSTYQIIWLFLIIVFVILFSSLYGAVLNVFKYGNWNLFYKEIAEKPKLHE